MTSLIRHFFFALLCLTRTAVAEVNNSPEPKTLDEMVGPPPSATMKKKDKDGKEGMEAVGEDIKFFGEQVAKRVDRVIKKKTFDLWGDPWTFQGIPLIFPSFSSGFNLGIKVQLQNIKRQDPHKAEVEAQILASDRGRYKHSFRIDIPHALDGKFRFTGRIAYDRDITFRYYGIGNDTRPDKDLVDQDSVLFQNVRAGPSLTFTALRYVGYNVRLGPILGLKWTQITAPSGSLLLAESPSGITGGRTHYLGWAIVHDTLDFEPYPSSGATHELYFYLYNKLTGSNYDFTRWTYTYRRYFLLHRRLILAHRSLFEVLAGEVPYYELGGVGGSNSSIGLGGDRFMRGYDSNRFIDKIRFVTGFELRWDPLLFLFAKQDFTIGFVPFFELGRVWPKVFPLNADRWHPSAGWGMRIIWNSRFVIRGDFAVTPEGTAFILNLNNSF